MSNPTSRRNFIFTSALTGAAVVMGAQNTLQQTVSQQSAPQRPADKPKPPALDLAMVKEFVIAGHVDLEKTQQMLKEQPKLLNAAWDWGGGDFEMAIGGAGHMGRADIAKYLISQGGRFDIFVAAMLGHLDLVKNALTLYPDLANSKGPHGIPLMVHAQKGGPAAEPVLRFLESLKS
jgi:hypothetical protein